MYSKKNRSGSGDKAVPFASIRGWFFDLDGTLADTDDRLVNQLAVRFRFLGASRSARLSRRLVMALETPVNRLITLLDSVGLDRALFSIKGKLRPAGAEHFELMAGADGLLRALGPERRVAIISTRSPASVAAFLDRHELRSAVDLVVTHESTRRLKPSPEPVIYAMRQLGLAPGQCLLVGDTPMDMLSARRAGVWAVGVLCGFGEKVELQRAGAHLVLPDTVDLRPLAAAL